MTFKVEDPKRRLLDVCGHSAPACWRCVAKDMERQRDEAEAALRSVPCMFEWWGKRAGQAYRVQCDRYDFDGVALPEHAWCPSCRARAALSGPGGAKP